MWSDEINKKMEEAGERNDPAFNEKAWDNMKLLLDEHLPVKKKRRRFIFFLLPLVLAGGTAFFITQQKRTKDIPLTDQKNTIVQPSSTDKLIDKTDNTLKTTTPSQNQTESKNPVETAKKNNRAEPGIQDSPLLVSKQSDKKKVRPVFSTKNSTLAQSSLKKNRNSKQPKATPADNNSVFESSDVTAIPADKSASINTVTNTTANPIATDKQATPGNAIKTEIKQEDTATAITPTDNKKIKSKTRTGNKLSLHLSFGPDISSVGVDNPGKLELQYGLGASYAISKRLSIRTGFFAVRKIYTADSGSYKTPYTIHSLQKVDANCLVYEIPLTLMYNFSADKKHNWFVAGGFSSYLMKNETYGYHYKNPWGTPQYYKRTYKNENTHFFSVINLSGGYQYHISDRLSVTAEPYIKIPASGIGVGKVKLNSAGMLFTVGFKPFAKRN